MDLSAQGNTPSLINKRSYGRSLVRSVVLARPGFADVLAIRRNQIFEMDPVTILEPGCLGEGLDELRRIVNQ